MTIYEEHDYRFMEEALTAAKAAALIGEVPVGAVLVYNNEIIASAHNASISELDPCAHAEIQVLRRAAKLMGNYRLKNCTLYVTLEPCCMCVGAIVHARLARLVYGAFDAKAGCVSSQFRLLDQSFLNHKTAHIGGLLETACRAILRNFFQAKRVRPFPVKEKSDLIPNT